VGEPCQKIPLPATGEVEKCKSKEKKENKKRSGLMFVQF